MDIDLHTIIGSTATRKAVLVKNAQKCGTIQAVTVQRAIVRIFMYQKQNRMLKKKKKLKILMKPWRVGESSMQRKKALCLLKTGQP